MSRTYLAENKTYKVGADCPRGYYLLTSNAGKQDADFNRYTEYPPKSMYTRSRCYCGCVEVGESDKYIRVENGNAVYLGLQPFDLYDALERATIEEGRVSNSGEAVFANEICKVKVHYLNRHVHLYAGDATAEVTDQKIVSVNNHFFWMGKVNVHSFKPYKSILFSFRYGLLRKTYTVGETGSVFLNLDKFSFSAEDKPVKTFRRGRESYYLVDLPKDSRPSQIALDWLRPSSSEKSYYHTEKTTLELFSNEYSRLASILFKYNELGTVIDIGKELTLLDAAPDYATVCAEFLEKEYREWRKLEKEKRGQDKKYIFRIPKTFDKKYYCAVKLAEKAIDVEADPDEKEYYVTFEGTQIDEIATMFAILIDVDNMNEPYMIRAKQLLFENSFNHHFSIAEGHLASFLREKYGYSGFVNNTVLRRIQIEEKPTLKEKIDDLYNEMVREHRITTRWSSEYKLFSIVQHYVPSAKYQYHCEWLGAQSFDIFIPLQRIAIEYQGEQHYKPIEVFGGEASFHETVERDAKKRQLSKENGVQVLDWRFDLPVNEENVLSFFADNGVEISTSPRAKSTSPSHNVFLKMAPVQETSKKKEKPARLSPSVIRQYDMDGHFVEEFNSISEASSLTGISEKSISNAVYGYRKSGGKYIWKRVPRKSPVENVAPVIPAENTGVGRAILQIDVDGNTIAEYPSKRAAASSTGINTRGISDVLDGVQKTAGGFVWKYKDE